MLVHTGISSQLCVQWCWEPEMGHRGSISTTEMESATNEGILFSREVVNGTPLDIQYDSSYVFFF